MLSKFFLDRPVFAWVIAIHDAGRRSGHFYIPISQYPPIAPPSIAIDAFYPGASAKPSKTASFQLLNRNDRLRQVVIHDRNQRFARLRKDRTDLCSGHGSGPCMVPVQNKLSSPCRAADVLQRQGRQGQQITRNYLIIAPDLGRRSMDGNDLRTIRNPTSRKCWHGTGGR
jgi:HAE1 family hydrophobic/amphiphilic exporter-1